MTRSKALLIAFAIFFPLLSHALSRLPPWATAVGTITSIDAERKLIRIVSDSVVIDVTAAEFHQSDPMGPEISFTDLVPGMLISADILQDDYQVGEPLRSNLILVLMQTNGQFDGLISSVDVASSSFTMLGKVFRVNERTVFASTLGGPPPNSIRDLVAGQHVLLEFNHNGDELEARKITILHASSGPLTQFRALISEMRPDLWILQASDPRVTAIKVTPQTQIVGTPVVGSHISVLATFENGIYVALSIAVVPPFVVNPNPHPLIDVFEGTVTKIEGDRWTIVPPDELIRVVRVVAETILTGSPTIGSYVNVAAARKQNIEYEALWIVARQPPDRPIQILNTQGVVTELTSTTLVITEAGLTQRRMTVTPETTFQGEPRVGDTVAVEAQVLPDGTLRALHVVKVASAPAELTVVGTVLRLNGDRWIVGRWTVLISPRTTISGDIERGDRVRVIGERQADTQYVVAHSIYEE
jgi:hypothetical protein